jgi:inosine-uridine nucleoside N-ribohydrolase
MSLPIILDCDPGNDDALGILVAAGHSGINLQAVTTGAGHLSGDRTARNAAKTLFLSGRNDIPVGAGALNPLVRERMIAGVLDMTSALDPERPDLKEQEIDFRHSSDLIIQTVLSEDTSTIVTTGPLTNLAIAFHRSPKIVDSLERIFVLGGSWGLGNKTAASEWNILCDPEAAHIVFNSGVPITMIPIDALNHVGITPELINRTSAIGGTVGNFATELLQSLVKTFQPSGTMAPKFMPLNDPVACIVAAQLEIAQTHPARVDIEISGQHTYGRTVVDFNLRNDAIANVDVVTKLDCNKTHDSFIDALTRLENLDI